METIRKENSRLIRLSTVYRSSSMYFPFVWFPSGDTQYLSVIPYSADVPCPGPLPSSDLFNHACDICLFSYPDACFFPLYVMFECSFPSLFVRLLAVLCMAGECHVSAPYVIAGSTPEL